jgi:hypothetical protein
MRIMIEKNRALTTAMFIILTFVVFAATTVPAGTIEVPKGREVKLKFPSDIKITSGNVSEGIPIVCYLAEPIDIGGVIVVEEGAQGTATVKEVVKPSKPGKPGSIKIEFTGLDAKGEYKFLSESKIKLTGTAEAVGKGKKTLSYLLIFGLFIKGGNAVIPTNVIYPAQVAESIYMEN